MGTRISELPATQADSGRVNVVVDTPKGSRNKFKFDEEHEQWRLSKVLPQGAYFPFDFGFIPSTMADDGDPLDVLLIAEEPAFAGCAKARKSRMVADEHGKWELKVVVWRTDWSKRCTFSILRCC